MISGCSEELRINAIHESGHALFNIATGNSVERWAIAQAVGNKNTMQRMKDCAAALPLSTPFLYAGISMKTPVHQCHFVDALCGYAAEGFYQFPFDDIPPDLTLSSSNGDDYCNAACYVIEQLETRTLPADKEIIDEVIDRAYAQVLELFFSPPFLQALEALEEYMVFHLYENRSNITRRMRRHLAKSGIGSKKRRTMRLGLSDIDPKRIVDEVIGDHPYLTCQSQHT